MRRQRLLRPTDALIERPKAARTRSRNTAGAPRPRREERSGAEPRERRSNEGPGVPAKFRPPESKNPVLHSSEVRTGFLGGLGSSVRPLRLTSLTHLDCNRSAIGTGHRTRFPQHLSTGRLETHGSARDVLERPPTPPHPIPDGYASRALLSQGQVSECNPRTLRGSSRSSERLVLSLAPLVAGKPE